MKREKNIKQHYIPQLYLRNFTNSEGYLNVYDIENDKEFLVKPSKVAYERYYHDVNTKIIEDILEIQVNNEDFVDEKIRILHEEKVSKSLKYLDGLIKNFNSKIEKGLYIDTKYIKEIIEFVILHAIRTSRFRKRLGYMSVAFYMKFDIDLEKYDLSEGDLVPIIHNLIIYGVIKYFEGKYDELPKKYKDFFDHFIEEQVGLYNQLLECSVLIIKNLSEIPFGTTKNPIRMSFKMDRFSYSKGLVFNMKNNDRVFDIGNNNQIERVFVPLSSNLGIYFFDSEFQIPKEFHGKQIGIVRKWNQDIIESLNISLAAIDNTQFYSSKKLSKLIKDAKINKNPNLCNLRF